MPLNTTLWRAHPQRKTGYLYLHNPAVVFSRSVTQTAFTYPLAQVGYGGSGVGVYGSTRAGQTIKVLSGGGALKGYTRARLAADAATIYLAETAEGDLSLATGDVLQFLDEYRLWPKTPRIAANGLVWKDYDLTFNNTANQQRPIANAGPWLARFTSGGVMTADFDGTGSFAVAPGAVITGYAWDFVDGTPAASSAASVNNVTFPPGARWISLTVTDSNAMTHTARALIAALDNNVLSPTPARIDSYRQTLEEGAAISAALLGSALTSAAIPPGAAVIYFEEESYGATAGSLTGAADREAVKFTGYLVENPLQITPLVSEVRVEASSPLAHLARLMAFPQVVEREASPGTWLGMAELNVWRYLVYLLRWHSTALEVCDLERPGWYASYPVLRLESPTGSLLDQAQDIASGVAARLTCDRSGRLLVRRIPHLLSDSDRSGLALAVNLADSDWTRAIEQTERFRDEVGFVSGSGLLADGATFTPLLSAAPGLAPGEGETTQNADRQLVVSQAELNQRAGDSYGFANRAVRALNLTILNQGGVADPALQERVTLTLPASSNRRGVSYGSLDYWQVQSVDMELDTQRGTSLERWQLTPETNGADGVTIPVTSPTNNTGYINQPPPSWTPPPVVDITPVNVDGTIVDIVSGIAVAWHNPVGYTPRRLSPGWTSIQNNGAMQSVIGDEFTARYTTGAGALGAYALAQNGSSGFLAYSADLTAPTLTFVTRQTFGGYSLLRLARGQNGGVAAWGFAGDGTPESLSESFVGGLGPFSAIPASPTPFGGAYNGTIIDGVYTADGVQRGAYSGTGGRGDNAGAGASASLGTLDEFGSTRHQISVVLDLQVPSVVTAASFYYRRNSGGQTTTRNLIAFQGPETNYSPYTAIIHQIGEGATSYTQQSWSGSQAGVRYLLFSAWGAGWELPDQLFLDDLTVEYTPQGGQKVFYSSAGGATGSQRIFGSGATGVGGMDCDDWNLGVIVASNGSALYYTPQNYSGSLQQAAVVGSVGPQVNVARIFYRRPTDNQPNNSPAALHLVWGATGSAADGHALWRGQLNASTGTIGGVVGVTPSVNGSLYRPVDGWGEQIEALASNAQVMAGLFAPLAGGATRLLVTTNAGSSWLDRGAMDYQFVRWADVGNQAFWLAGSAGIGYSADRGVSIADRTGDYATQVGGAGQVRGVWSVG
jgi:hypothetical protein